MQIIAEKLEYIEKGTEEWTTSAALLKWVFWKEDENYRKLEKKLLEKELKKQWVSDSSSDVMLKNLDEYNKSEWVWWKLWTRLSNMVSTNMSEVWKDIKKAFTENEKDTRDYSANNLKLQVTQNIYEEVSYQYWKMKSNITEDSPLRDKQIINLINLHNTLRAAYNYLAGNISLAEKNCDRQCSDKWTCSISE